MFAKKASSIENSLSNFNCSLIYIGNYTYNPLLRTFSCWGIYPHLFPPPWRGRIKERGKFAPTLQ